MQVYSNRELRESHRVKSRAVVYEQRRASNNAYVPDLESTSINVERIGVRDLLGGCGHSLQVRTSVKQQ